MRVQRLGIDPQESTQRIGYQVEGFRSQRDMERRDDDGERFGDDRRKGRIITQETLIWYRAGVGASGDSATGYIMRPGGQSSDTAWAAFTLPLQPLGQGRILAIRLYSSAACTQGEAYAAINVIEDGVTSLQTFDEVVISTTNTRQARAKFDWEIARQFGKDATLEGRIVTTNVFQPTSSNMTLVATFGYENW